MWCDDLGWPWLTKDTKFIGKTCILATHYSYSGKEKKKKKSTCFIWQHKYFLSVSTIDKTHATPHGLQSRTTHKLSPSFCFSWLSIAWTLPEKYTSSSSSQIQISLLFTHDTLQKFTQLQKISIFIIPPQLMTLVNFIQKGAWPKTKQLQGARTFIEDHFLCHAYKQDRNT